MVQAGTPCAVSYERWTSLIARASILYPVLHIRSIERIYGNKGPDVVEKLFNNPGSTL